MEWNWRTVIILLGLMLIIGIVIDGIRRMRRARAEVLRLDIDPDFVSSREDFDNPELPNGGWRLVTPQETQEKIEPEFTAELASDIELDRPSKQDETVALGSLSTQSEHEFILEESLTPVDEVEPKDEVEQLIEFATESEAAEPTFTVELAEEAVEEPLEELIEQRSKPKAEPVNLNDKVPVLLDVEELGEEEAQPQVGLSANQTAEHRRKDAQQAELNFFAVPEESLPAANQQPSKQQPKLAEEATEEVAEKTIEEITEQRSEQENLAAENTVVELATQEAPTQQTPIPQATVAQTEEELASAQPAILLAGPTAEKLSDLAPTEMALVVHCILPAGTSLPGAQAVQIFNKSDLRLGEDNIFHRYELKDGQGHIQFSMVHSFSPQDFDANTVGQRDYRGFSFFMRLPGPKQPLEAYETMVDLAKYFERYFKADLFDLDRSALTQQTIEHERQQIIEFERRQKLAAKKQMRG